MKKINKNRILFIIATHGDEGYPLGILKDLEKKYPKKQYNYDWVIGNELAFQEKVRYINEDLNRSAPGELDSLNYESKRAAEILKLAEQFDIVIDIHGAISNVGIVTIIPKPTFENLFLASLLPIKNNLIWAASESISQGPLVQFINKPGIEIECGPQSSKTLQKEIRKILENIIEGNLELKTNDFIKKLKSKKFYQVYGLINNSKRIFRDFEKTEFENESFYPLLSQQYKGINCYKMKEVDFNQLFLY